MAIYHFSMKASSSNSAAHFCYISATDAYDAKSDVRESHDMNMPSCSGAEFWIACDKDERSNGNKYKEFEISLPLELNKDEQQKLAFQFVDEFIPSQPCTLAIHEGKNGDNPHLHLMFSMRANDNVERENIVKFFKRANKKHPERGGAPKVDFWTDRGFGKEIAAGARPKFLDFARKRVEVLINDALEAAGHHARVDCRSLVKQGITDRIAQPKIGFAAQAIEAREKDSSTRVKRFDEVMCCNNQNMIEVRNKKKVELYKAKENHKKDDAIAARFDHAFALLDRSKRAVNVAEPSLLTVEKYVRIKGIKQTVREEYRNERYALKTTEMQINQLSFFEFYKLPALILKASFQQKKINLLHEKHVVEFNEIEAKVDKINKPILLEYKQEIKEAKADRKRDFEQAKLEVEALKSELGLGFDDLKQIASEAKKRQEIEASERQAKADAEAKIKYDAEAPKRALEAAEQGGRYEARQAQLQAQREREAQQQPSMDMGM